MSEIADLRAEADELRDEALELIERIGLCPLLSERFGSAAIVGSVDLDLMTWRDIDMSVPVGRAQKDVFIDMLSPIAAAIEAPGCCLYRATFNDEWAVPRGDYGSGYYWGLRVRTAAGEIWKIDLWGWEPSTYEAKLATHAELKQRLAGVDRELVLQLKHEAMQQPGFRNAITSWDIYQRVLNPGG